MLHRRGEDGTYGWRPNINGYAYTLTFAGANASGALSQIEFTANTGYVAGTSVGGIRNIFNAHNSNSIYVDNGKVYPLSLALNFIIKA